MEILSEFGINPLLLAAQVVNFLILLFILRKFLYGPILKILAERKQKIADSLKNAEQIEKKLLEISEEEQLRIRNAASEGEKIIKQAQESGVQIIEEAKVKAEAVAEKIMIDAKSQLQLEREKLQKEIRENLSELVVLALQKVIGKTMTREDEQKAISQAIKDLEP